VPLSAFRIELLLFAAAAVLTVIILNRDLYAFFYQQRGLSFASACVPLHMLYYCYSGLSYLFVWAMMLFQGTDMHSRNASERR
jgi:hypothetical protein